MIDYIEFSNNEFDKLSKIQNKFIKKYNTESFPNWFYDQESQLLRLYNDDDDELFFKYIPVGTYSPNANTWMWSWFNEGSIENNKNTTLRVKKFGEQNNYGKLVEGTFPCEVNECWEFTAISQKLIESIGVYCTKSEDLLKYMLLTEKVNNTNSKEVRKLKQMVVDCGIHGFRRSAFVCQHLNTKSKTGFEEAFETYHGMELEDDDDFAAWCDECEKIRIEHDGWNEESEKFAKIKLVCEECYFEMKKLNKK